MAKQRTCRAEIITADGESTGVVYKSFYPIGSRGNYLDMVWRASILYDLSFEGDQIDSIFIKYVYGDDTEK